ncbi:phage/plasmid primase, P4 family [Streptococcus sp. zg-JUN1979]|uniref:DNA primase family protein n=1 Tax=Streptococcus sp. zg-JUN1979 TaxID=3391450 RepID=UPI0039A71B4E
MNLEELSKEFEQSKAESDFSEPRTMKELEDKIYQAGELWRAENTTINEKKGKKTVPLPSHGVVAKYLIKLCQFTFIGKGGRTDNSPLYVYNLDTGLYTFSQDLLNRLCYKFDPRLKSTHVKESLLVIRTKTKMRLPFDNPNLIPVANGVFNKKTHKLEPFSPSYIITAKIKTAYNEEASKPILGGWFDFERWLESIACDDEEIVTLLWQVMDEAINPNRTRNKMAILYGEGNNGKGTFQSLLVNLIGMENIATLKPDQFKDYHPSTLEGKVANIGDDISNKFLDDVSDLMSIVSGDPITVNPKMQKPYEATFKLFCLFSGNDLPRARNKSQGWYRRLCIIPFNADFNGQKERPEIKREFLKDKKLLEWVLYKILNMADFETFIEPKAVSDVLESYKKDNDYTVAFIVDDYMARDLHLVRRVPLTWIKEEYITFLEMNDLQQHIPYGFGKGFVKSLADQTGGTYILKKGRMGKKDVEEFPELLTDTKYVGNTDNLVVKQK